MHYYLAPMEGITTYIYRNAYAHYFGGIDKYFTPFVSDKNFVSDKDLSAGPNNSRHKNTREIRDILPENNTGITLIPQIMSNDAPRFLAAAAKIASYGYDTVNLNLGCPSGTVTARKRGSGFLSVPDELDAFLSEIYDKCPIKISIKTRLGISELAEWDRLIQIYAKYPIDELIIHTRLQQEFYAGKTHPECFAAALSPFRTAGISLCYNGDIVSAESLRAAFYEIRQSYNSAENTGAANNGIADTAPSPATAHDKDAGMPDRVMIGRGILQNPGLIRQLRSADSGCSGLSNDSGSQAKSAASFHDDIHAPAAGTTHHDTDTSKAASFSETAYRETLRAFHDEILDGYVRIMSGDSPTLFKMKDLWTYMSRNIPGAEKQLKKIRKANRLTEYTAAVDGLFRECDICPL